MPSFDFTSEADIEALKNAIDVTSRQIDNRYDFKGTTAKVELNEKDKVITLHGDSDFQLDQIKDLLFPAMEKKEKESVTRLDHQKIQSVSGNKVKQEMKIKDGIDSELAKEIVKMIKDGKLKVQASDLLENRQLHIDADMVVLAAAIGPDKSARPLGPPRVEQP